MNTGDKWAKTSFILAGIFSICWQAVFAQTNFDCESSTGRVDSLVNASKALLENESQSIEPLGVIRVARGLMYRVRAEESDKMFGKHPAYRLLEFGKDSTPESRRACVIKLLGTNLYVQLENRFLKLLSTSTNESEKITAFEMLSKGLVSSNAVEKIVKELNFNRQLLETDNATNTPSRSVLFWASESLCHLGQTNGLDIMSWALESEKTSPAEKLVAIDALVTLHEKEAREILLQSAKGLAFSKDSHVAANTFDALHRVPEFRGMGTRAGMIQLKRLKHLCEKTELSKDDQLLLSNISSHFFAVQEKGLLSLDEQRKVKRTTIDMLRIGRKEGILSLANIFGTLATDEDAQVIKELLKSDSATVRRQAIWSVLKCTPDVQKSLLADVMPLLKDEDIQNRKAALDVIRVAKGEKKLKEVNSEKDFKAEMDRVKAEEENVRSPAKP